jgi:sugar lactone lactonase YvrE
MGGIMRLALIAIVFAASAALAGPKDDLAKFAASAQTALAAYKAGDYPKAETGFADALAHAPQRPSVLYYLAASAARTGENAKALALLHRYAEMGVPVNAEASADFAGLARLAFYRAVQARMAANRNPVCRCRTFYQGTAEPFIAEGLARDGDRVFVGGVAARRILAIAHGRTAVFVDRLPGGYSPFGMVADRARGLLWVSAAVVAQSGGATPATLDQSALVAFDLASGTLRALYPAQGKRSLGDIALGPDGTVYVSDSLEGSLFRLVPQAKALERVGAAGMFASAQGIVASADGRQLLVADYEMGLLRVDLATGQLRTIRIPADATTIGIDGLARQADGSFVATQNAFKSARILHLRLAPDWSALTSLDVLAANTPDTADPSLILADGNGAIFVGLAQWAAFGDAAKPAHALPAWKLIRLEAARSRPAGASKTGGTFQGTARLKT